jgi:hypothetical protein
VNPIVIGLFGTCGVSTWRQAFIDRYQQQGITYYNPQRPDWNPAYALEENEHLHRDDIVLFPVTAETTGVGSLGETGFCVLSVLQSLSTDRYAIIMIEDDCSDPLADAQAAKQSRNGRALVKTKVKEAAQAFRNVYLVDTLAAMLELSLALHDHVERGRQIRQRFGPA